MKKYYIKINLEKISLVSCSIAAFLLLIEIAAVLFFSMRSTATISALMLLMNTAITICMASAFLQHYIETRISQKEE
ncbi:MAG: hypothetical protein LLG09_04565 [Negativicutes bacterium]|nr:hypothetical protein [Negativicutes bacterium]